MVERKQKLLAPWRYFSLGLGVLGAIAMAAFVPGSGSAIEAAAFGFAAAVSLVVGVRALLSRVVLTDEIRIHAIWSTRSYQREEIEKVSDEVMEDRLVAVMWAPVIHLKATNSEPIVLRSLMGYSLPGRRNRRVGRQTRILADWLSSGLD